MKVEFDKSFEKSLQKIKNKSLFSRIEKIILVCEKSESLSEISNLKRIAGF